MNKSSSFSASAQIMFSIDNLTSGLPLVINPPVYRMIMPSGTGDPIFEMEKYFDDNSSGGRFFTELSVNDYGRQHGYHSTRSLSMKTESETYSFELVRKGGQVTYSSSENASLFQSNVLYGDILGAVYLKMGPLEASNKKVEPVQESDSVYCFSEGGSGENLAIASTSKSQSKTIPDTETFSFLVNVAVYFSGDLYQSVNGRLERADRLGRGLPVFGGYYALTGDEDKLYPDGVSEITIKDGFSDGQAVIEFKHNAQSRTVTITVKSHTSKLCDIRDLTEVGWGYPNTICFAL